MPTTVGRILVNAALPEQYRSEDRVITKSSLRDLLREVAQQSPHEYLDITRKLNRIGRDAAYTSGGLSFGLKHIRQTPAAKQARQALQQELEGIYADDSLSDQKREEKILLAVGRLASKQQKDLLETALAENNPLAHQVKAGVRGSPMNLASILGSDLLYTDNKDRALPVPVLRSFSQGLTPLEYWAGSFGARRGVVSLKLATPEAGYFGKVLSQVAHRTMVTDLDDPKPPDTLRGVPVPLSDPDNEGALLANDAGGYKRNTVLTPKVLADLRNQGLQRILVRSPISGGSEDGGVYARDVGMREFSRLPVRGEQVGITAAQALCLAEGTLVQMADGNQKPIETIQPGEEVLGCSIAGVVRSVKVLASFDNGEQDCVRSVFRRGTGQSAGFNLLELISTPQHKILSEIVNRRCAGLKRSTYWHPVAIRPVSTCIPAEKVGGDRFCAKLTSSFDDTGLREEPLALALGLLIGDGCYTGVAHVLQFSCCDPLLVSDLREHLLPLGFELKNNTENEYRLIDASSHAAKFRKDGTWYRNRLQELLRQEGMWGQRSGEKTLPRSIYSWTNASILALVAGLLATDGSIDGMGSISFSSTSLALLYHTRQLLGLRFGIWGTSIYDSKKKRQEGGHYSPCYKFAVARHDDVTRLADCSPLIGIKHSRLQSRPAVWNTKNRAPTGRPREPGRCTLMLQESAGRRHVYDLYVAHPDHLFLLANGLVVSNSEPLAQGMIGAKHGGGIAGSHTAQTASGFEYLQNLVAVPKTFKGAAAHAETDGTVQQVEDAPDGGKYVTIDGQRHYVARGYELKVSKGDKVEAGDVISEGIPNPAIITEHKGIGEARKYFTQAFTQGMRESGLPVHRRGVELIARGLINHVRLTDEVGDYATDDVLPYSLVEQRYRPRTDAKLMPAKEAVGKYLEKPYLHHTLGTKVRASMLPDFKEFGVDQVLAHEEPPPFRPEMIRGMASLTHDPDWLVRMYGSGLKTGLLHATHRGEVSDETSTSFVPGLARGAEFGRIGRVITPKPDVETVSPVLRKSAANAYGPMTQMGVMIEEGQRQQAEARARNPLQAPLLNSGQFTWQLPPLTQVDIDRMHAAAGPQRWDQPVFTSQQARDFAWQAANVLPTGWELWDRSVEEAQENLPGYDKLHPAAQTAVKIFTNPEVAIPLVLGGVGTKPPVEAFGPMATAVSGSGFGTAETMLGAAGMAGHLPDPDQLVPRQALPAGAKPESLLLPEYHPKDPNEYAQCEPIRRYNHYIRNGVQPPPEVARAAHDVLTLVSPEIPDVARFAGLKGVEVVGPDQIRDAEGKVYKWRPKSDSQPAGFEPATGAGTPDLLTRVQQKDEAARTRLHGELERWNATANKDLPLMPNEVPLGPDAPGADIAARYNARRAYQQDRARKVHDWYEQQWRQANPELAQSEDRASQQLAQMPPVAKPAPAPAPAPASPPAPHEPTLDELGATGQFHSFTDPQTGQERWERIPDPPRPSGMQAAAPQPPTPAATAQKPMPAPAQTPVQPRYDSGTTPVPAPAPQVAGGGEEHKPSGLLQAAMMFHAMRPGAVDQGMQMMAPLGPLAMWGLADPQGAMGFYKSLKKQPEAPAAPAAKTTTQAAPAPAAPAAKTTTQAAPAPAAPAAKTTTQAAPAPAVPQPAAVAKAPQPSLPGLPKPAQLPGLPKLA